MPRELQNASSWCVVEHSLESASSRFLVSWRTRMILSQLGFQQGRWCLMGQTVTDATFFLFIPGFHSLTSIGLWKMRKRKGGRRLPCLSFAHSTVVYARLQILMLSLSQKPGPASIDTQLIRPASNWQDKFMVLTQAGSHDTELALCISGKQGRWTSFVLGSEGSWGI